MEEEKRSKGPLWWVIQEIKGTLRLDGPYKQKKSAENRYDNIQGGEVHIFGSFNRDPKVVEVEFKEEQLEKL